MPDDFDFDAFWRGHELATDIARAALTFCSDRASYDDFQYAMRRIYDQHCVPLPDNVRPPRPRLRLVLNGD
jgi:hypothetical protein